MSMNWQPTGVEVMIGRHSLTTGTSPTALKLAVFDLDSTLIVAKSGELKADDPTDWAWWNELVPLKLRQASIEGFDIVVITNQGRLTTEDGCEAPAARSFRAKVSNIFHSLNLPITIYVACANDNWRKPRTRTWCHLVDSLGPDRMVDMPASYFVGDAAGRSTDHSDDDRHFAMNIGIKFYTPEQFFLGESPQDWHHKFDPSQYLPLVSSINSPHTPPPVVDGDGETRTSMFDCKKDGALMLLLVGLPGSGKTTYYRDILGGLGYERITPASADSAKLCVELVSQRLKSRKPIAIDQINQSRAVREPWITLARAHSVRIVAVHLTTPAKLCLHNDAVRALGGTNMNWETRKVYPRTQFWDLVQRFEPPDELEGFYSVLNVAFEWTGTAGALRTWRRYWI